MTVTKVAVITGAILLLAGVATAGTVAGLGSSDDTPTVSIPAVGTTTGEVGTTTGEVKTTTVEDRRENELRGRENEPGEDVRGPCDELEHANDPRCTDVQTVEDDDGGEHRGRDDADDDRREDRSGPSENSGPGNDGDDDSGGDDRSGHSGRGGGDDD
jgi:hypothetical protein